MITSFKVLTVCSYLFKKRGFMKLNGTQERKVLVVLVGIWLSMIALIGILMVSLWGLIQNKALIELKTVFVIAFGLGSMLLIMLIGSLYVILRAFHL